MTAGRTTDGRTDDQRAKCLSPPTGGQKNRLLPFTQIADKIDSISSTSILFASVARTSTRSSRPRLLSAECQRAAITARALPLHGSKAHAKINRKIEHSNAFKIVTLENYCLGLRDFSVSRFSGVSPQTSII